MRIGPVGRGLAFPRVATGRSACAAGLGRYACLQCHHPPSRPSKPWKRFSPGSSN